MRVDLSKEEMLAGCRLAGGFEPLRTDCSVEQTAGVDVDAVLLQRLRGRYLELLDSGDCSLLAPDDVAASATLVQGMACGSVVEAPAGVRRVLMVKLSGWECEARVLPACELPIVLSRQRNPFTAAEAHSPVAVALEAGRVAAWPAAEGIAELVAVVDPGPERYILDQKGASLLWQEYSLFS